MPATRYFTDDDAPIQVEIAVAPTTSGLRDTGLRDEATKRLADVSSDALFNAFRTIYKVARKTEMLMSDLQAEATAAPDLKSAEVSFGLKFSANGEAFVSAGVEASINVTLTWEHKS
jgi:hypothetical protein